MEKLKVCVHKIDARNSQASLEKLRKELSERGQKIPMPEEPKQITYFDCLKCGSNGRSHLNCDYAALIEVD